jgi:hypothetical protein
VLSQSADIMASGASEFHGMAVRYTDEHLQLSFGLAQRLTGANDLKEAHDILTAFAQHTAEAYARQFRELSRFVARFTPKTSPEAGSELLL